MTTEEYQPPKSIDDYRKRVADYMSEKGKEKLEKHKNQFFTKVNKNGPLYVEPHFPEIYNTHCWDWTSRLNTKGYGLLGNPKYSQLAHRESYMLHNEGVVEDVKRHRSVYRITKVDVKTGKPLGKSKEMTREDIELEFKVGKRAIGIAVKKTKQIGYVQNVPGKMKTKFHGYRVKDLGTRELKHKTQTGKVIDHKCNNRLCVNPSHLYPTTRRGNNAHTRAEGRAQDFGGKSNRQGRPRAATCPSGHGRENMRNWPNGNEYCKVCNDRDKSRRVKKHRDLKKIAQLSTNQPPPGPLGDNIYQ
jgi:hypothetical protein